MAVTDYVALTSAFTFCGVILNQMRSLSKIFSALSIKTHRLMNGVIGLIMQQYNDESIREVQ